MESPFDCLLNLPGVTVVGRSQVEGCICFHLKMLAREMDCPHCGKATKELHQVRPILVRDLPSFGQPVYLKVPRRNFYCRACQKYVTERVEFLNWRRQYTRRYEENIYQRVLHNSVEQISREEGLTYEQIEGIFSAVSSREKKKTGVKSNGSVWMKSVNERATEIL